MAISIKSKCPTRPPPREGVTAWLVNLWRHVKTLVEAVDNAMLFSHAYRVEDLAADADITGRPVFARGDAVKIDSVYILTEGASAGVDDSNTAAIELVNAAGNTVASVTYDSDSQPPDTAFEELALDATDLAAEEVLKLNVTQGTTADLPAFQVIIEYRLA